MKKVLLALLAIASTVLLVGCGEKLVPYAITWNDDVQYYTGDDFDVLDGVKATNTKGEDITDELVILNIAALKLEGPDADKGVGKFTTTGDFFIRYRIMNDKVVELQQDRMFTVKQYIDPEQGLVGNGDFSSGLNGWVFDKTDGAAYTTEVIDGQLVIVEEGIGANLYSGRFRQGTFELEQDGFYEVKFKAKADAPRQIHIQTGEMLSAAPWFYKFDQVTTYINLTTEMQEFTFRFQANANGGNLANATLLFEFGSTAGATATTMVFDDISVKVTDSLGSDTAAPIIVTPTNDFYIGDAFDAKAGVTVTDNFDGEMSVEDLDITIPSDMLVDGKFHELGEYTVTYKITDTAGNEAVLNRKVVVANKPEGDSAIFNPDFSDYTEEDGVYSFNNWKYEGSTAVAVENGIAVTVNNSGAEQTWDNQLFQQNTFIEQGSTYTIKFDISSTLDRDIIVLLQNQGDAWILHHHEVYSITSETQTIEFEVTIEDYTLNPCLGFMFGKIEDTVLDEDHTITITNLTFVLKK